MDLKSPSTLAVAWLIVPLLVVLASAGLGAGLSRVVGIGLGSLTLPAGFVTGVALMTFALEVGVGGVATVVLCVACALAGLLAFLIPRRRALLNWRPEPELLWLAGCGLAAFAIALAPLVGSGRSGILGYVFNNDSSVHISAVELLRDNGADAVDVDNSLFDSVGSLFSSGYPIGSHVWPLFGGVVGGIDAFHIWTPLIAVMSAMTALVCFTVVRWLGAPAPFAAIAGAVVASGYLPYSYFAQGSAKEIGTALTLYATVALFVLGLNAGLRLRALVPAAIGVAAALDTFGVGALAWLGPAALLGALIALLRARTRDVQLRTLGVLAVGVSVALVAALPSVVSSLDFVETNEGIIVTQTGNLLGPVPWSEAFNVWLAYDYRNEFPDVETLTHVAILLTALLALAGLLYALRRRAPAIPLAVFSAVAGAILISSRYSIYIDAKTYVVLAPALGMASAAGVLWLYRGPARTRLAAIGLGLLLATGVMVSDAMVYAGAWVTPKDRFQELIDLNERFRGQGPILVNEREWYAKYLLRDVAPWDAWDGWQPPIGLRFAALPAPPRTPDFDDYTEAHMSRFRLLLERRRPGGSLPPGNFGLALETPHYRVWQRVGPPPRKHLPLGGTLSGQQVLDCATPVVRRLFEEAADRRERLRVAHGGARPILSQPDDWLDGGFDPGPQKGVVIHRRGAAAIMAQLPRGRYSVYAQGSFGPGVRLFVDRHLIGETFGDLEIHDGWQPLGSARVRRSPALALVLGLDKPWWQSGSRRHNTQGPLAFVPTGPKPRIARVEPSRATRLCGRSLDWVELP